MTKPPPPGPTSLEYEPSGLPRLRTVLLAVAWLFSLGVAFWLGYRTCFFAMRDDILAPLYRMEARLGGGMRELDAMLMTGEALEMLGASPKGKVR